MIFDTINNLKKYLPQQLVNSIENVIFKTSLDLTECEFLDNEMGFYKVIAYNTKENDFIIESHLKYIDIQIVLNGQERINIYKQRLNIKRDYNSQDDCIFYVNNLEHYDASIILKKGYFAVFFQDDIHETQISNEEKVSEILKIVFKINEKFFSRSQSIEG